jgi:hypothetical protein
MRNFLLELRRIHLSVTSRWRLNWRSFLVALGLVVGELACVLAALLILSLALAKLSIGLELAAFVIVLVLYILSIRRALVNCSPATQGMAPDQAWLLLVPLFNLAWHFYVVSAVANSLGIEFKCASVPNAPREPGKSLGTATCILLAAGLVLLLFAAALGARVEALGDYGGPGSEIVYPASSIGTLLSTAGLVCWVVYWTKIATYSQILRLLHEEEIKA